MSCQHLHTWASALVVLASLHDGPRRSHIRQLRKPVATEAYRATVELYVGWWLTSLPGMWHSREFHRGVNDDRGLMHFLNGDTLVKKYLQSFNSSVNATQSEISETNARHHGKINRTVYTIFKTADDMTNTKKCLKVNTTLSTNRPSLIHKF